MQGIPKRFVGLDLSAYDVRKGDEAVDRTVREWVDNLETNITSAHGLLFVGPPGVAKTMLSAIVLQEAMKAGSSGYFIKLEQYMLQTKRLFVLQSAWQKVGDEAAYMEWRALDRQMIALRNDYQLVVLDDVGKEYKTASGFAENEFDFLVRHRYDRGLTTILTSNLPIKDWSNYSESMLSFIHEICDIVPFDAPDYRRKRR